MSTANRAKSPFKSPGHYRRVLAGATLGIAVLSTPRPASAAAGESSIRKAKVVLVALTYDRALKNRSKDGKIVVAVLGECETASIISLAAGKSVNGMTIVIEILKSAKAAQLAKELTDAGAAAVFVCSGAAQPQEIGKAATEAHALTISDDPEWVNTFFSMGVEDKGERTQLVLNLNVASDQGADFDPRIRAFARLTD